MEVDIDYMRSANQILDLDDCDVALQLHLPIAKFPIRYLAESAPFFLSEMGNWISNRTKTTFSNKDAMRNTEEFPDPGLNREIAICDM